MTSIKRCREQGGATLLETLFALPIFFMFVFAIIELSGILRQYVTAVRALSMAAHQLATASAVENMREEVMLNLAGQAYEAEIERAGIRMQDVAMGTAAGESFVLLGRRYTLSGTTYPAPPAYELRSRSPLNCIFCPIFGVQQVRVTAVQVLETPSSAAWLWNQNHNNEAAAYFPALSGDAAVKWVNVSNWY